MQISNDRPVVLRASDQGIFTDRDGQPHNVFQQNRRVLILSVPKLIDFHAVETAADDLIDVVAAAMAAEVAS